MDAPILFTAAANYVVAALYAITGIRSKETRELLAAVAWMAAGTCWLMRALEVMGTCG